MDNQLAAPSRPKGPLKVQDVTAQGCKLKWEKPEDDGGKPITAYSVEKLDVATGRWVPVGRTSGGEPEMEVRGLQEGHEYQFRVKAINEEGESEPLDSDGATLAKNPYDIPGKPGVPEFIDWDVDRVVLKWAPPKSNGGAPITSYIIEAKEKFSASWNEMTDTGSSACEGTVLGLKEGNTYQFRVRAVNKAGPSEPSDPTKQHVAKARNYKPGAPEGPLEVTDIHKEGCKLKWEKPKDDGGLPLHGYVVEKMDVATGRWVPAGFVDPSKTEHEVTGLEPGHKYQFRVKAQNEEGESEPLETDAAILAKNPYDPPGAPGLPEIVDWDEHNVELKWEPPFRDGGAPITGYIIEMKSRFEPNFVKAVEITGNTCKGKVPKLEEGTQYQFRVKAVNKAGPGEPSEETNPHTAKARWQKPRIDRTNLQNLVFKVGHTALIDVNVTGELPPTITWIFKDKSENPKEVELQTEGAIRIDNVDYNTKLLLMKASRKESGKYTIIAKNSVGEDRAETDITILGKPSKPKGLLKVSDVTKNGCKLKWDKPEDDGGSPVEYYEIEKLDPLTGQWIPCGKSVEPEANITGLQEGKPYKFRVRAVNKEGESEELETDHAIIAKNPFDEPSKPGRPNPTNWDKDFIDLEWAKPASDGGAPIEKYIIQMKDRDEGPKWVDVATVPGDRTHVQSARRYSAAQLIEPITK